MDRINITKTYLPPLEEYETYLQKIWDSSQLTNQGPLLKEFEKQAGNYLGLDNFQFVSNGTLALQVAIRALDLNGSEIITTPFSYVATTSSILWENCTPVYVDIEPETFTIDAEKIEAAISDKTKAIMPVHVFGYPCNVTKIDEIAKKHGLKVIYDAAHAFGVEYRGKSLLDYGDVATCSFHATKLFHTIEGGAIICRDKELSEKIDLTKRFGHNGDDHFILGMNAKANEFQAAMGLCNLKYVDQSIALRQQVHELYEKMLNGANIKKPIVPESKHNYAYYPVVFENEEQLHRVTDNLNKINVYPRRYFYPSLNKLPYVDDGNSCPVSEDIASRVLCLPLYAGLETEIVNKICEVINEETV